MSLGEVQNTCKKYGFKNAIEFIVVDNEYNFHFDYSKIKDLKLNSEKW